MWAFYALLSALQDKRIEIRVRRLMRILMEKVREYTQINANGYAPSSLFAQFADSYLYKSALIRENQRTS
jgi:hypothetical protein